MRVLIFVGALAAAAAGCEATPCDENARQACAGDPSGSESTGGGWNQDRTFRLGQGLLSEAGISMREGDWVDIDYGIVGSESAPVAWNVHTHVTDDTLDHSKLAGPGSQGRGESGTYRFVAPADGVYWSLWTNDGSPDLEIQVSYHGEGATAFTGWR
jgi:hypothetical protein